MSCLEKRHTTHRMGSMLHHRFPNGFMDLFMDETDREVSTLTDRAFRSLCIGDDAVYNDDFLYGYSPYSCLKPLVGEPLKKTQQTESKKGKHKSEKGDAHPLKQQQQNSISHMSSFLKVLSAAEESCDGMLITNRDVMDANGESWDKSALRSIERELSEFSDYHTSLADGHYKNCLPHQSGSCSSNSKGKDDNFLSGKSPKIKSRKYAVKLRKLNIKNFFLHSEFSPFQTWTDLNRYPFAQDNTVTNILSADNISKWYDLPFYKELTEAHRKETLHSEEPKTHQIEAVEPSDAKVTKPIPAPPALKGLPKPSAPPAEKRCSSDGGEGHAAPWRCNKSRAKSAVPPNYPGVATQESNSKVRKESILLSHKEAKAVEVKAVKEVSSLASTPFSICQLMTPVIPSRQPTETSEILQAVFSPSALDLLGRPHSEAKGTPEPPVKRESYKSLASSILFNLKDNRKRVKSRYSPPKFKASDPPEGGTQSPQTDHVTRTASEGSGSGLSTPAVLKDCPPFSSPPVEAISSPNDDLTKHNSDKPLSDDYLLLNLLQSKQDAVGSSSHGDGSPISPFMVSKKNKSPMSKKQNYPSLNLYKKASPVDSGMKYLQVPLSTSLPVKTDAPTETKDRELPANVLPTNTGLSPSTLNVIKDYSRIIPPHTLENSRLSSDGKRPPNVPEKTKRVVKDANEKDFTVQEAPKESDPSGQTINTINVIRAAREAINAARKARSASYPDSINKQLADSQELRQNEMLGSRRGSSATDSNVLSQNDSNETLVSKSSYVSKEPPPVPKRNFAKTDLQASLDKQQKRKANKSSNGDSVDEKHDSLTKENGPAQRQDQAKNLFSSKLNNYIKHQRYAETDDEQNKECEESSLDANTKRERDIKMALREMRESEHIFNDLQDLKELEKARFGERMLDNTRRKLEAFNIDEKAKAKNNLISRELQNIKRGMLSMRGNTSAKRKIFAKQKEQSKQESFSKVDGQVIVNRALLNDNYDKAKMALEEVISEREKRQKNVQEQDSAVTSEENITGESFETWVQEDKKGIRACTDEEDATTTELNTQSGDSGEHSLQKHIFLQTPPDEPQRWVELSGIDTVDDEVNELLKPKQIKGKLADNPAQEINFEGHSKSSGQSGSTDKMFDTPPVPPRNKKGGNNKRDGSSTEEKHAEGDVFTKGEFSEKLEEQIINMSSDVQDLDYSKDLPSQREGPSYKQSQEQVNDANLNLIAVPDIDRQESKLPSNHPCLSPKLPENQSKANRFDLNTSPRKTTIANAPETCKKKRKAPLKPDHILWLEENVTKGQKAEELDKVCNEGINIDEEVHCEVPRTTVSPLLLVNGISIAQSPPDQSSLSSKSSYFSVESAFHRNTETESNVYHSLENLTQEMDEVGRPGQSASQEDLDRAFMECYPVGDQERELEVIKQQIKSPQKESVDIDGEDKGNVHKHGSLTRVGSDPAASPTDAFSPTLGIPALFKVKDNTFNHKTRKPVAPWSPRASLNISERVEEVSHQTKETPGILIGNETPGNNSTTTLLLSPSNTQSENLKKSPAGIFLTVPLEEDMFSSVTPSSEGIESTTTSTADEIAMNAGVLVENEGTKAPSKCSGSICSGSDSQTELPKPPAVLPKSDKAVQKAIKLTNRRMKKEEAQKLSHKTSQSGSKHKSDRSKSDKSEQKTNRGAKADKNGEKKHREIKESPSHNDSYQSNDGNGQKELIPSCTEDSYHTRAETLKAQRESQDSLETTSQSNDALLSPTLERQGRSSDRHMQEKSKQRDYSSDRVISNVPVYKTSVDERPALDRPFHRSQSIDRYLGGKAERRLSADVSASEKPESRSQRIEKSLVNELQQRGRVRNKASNGNPLRRSHSIDTYSTEAPSLSRQSSRTSQLSRQSSIEHTIVTQSFPMTQRKLLQDPNSGQYYFVDLPVQIKTKTFIDPRTGSYVQLPVQPTEGMVPQGPHMEVLTPPMVVYHRFVPVPLSPMAQNTAIQAQQIELEDLEQRHGERARQMHCKEGYPYLEPVYGQHDHMLGEFMGTEELDCPS
nr:uncharacterized protein LOC107388264 [Nothobranchius furzeri]